MFKSMSQLNDIHSGANLTIESIIQGIDSAMITHTEVLKEGGGIIFYPCVYNWEKREDRSFQEIITAWFKAKPKTIFEMGGEPKSMRVKRFEWVERLRLKSKQDLIRNMLSFKGWDCEFVKLQFEDQRRDEDVYVMSLFLIGAGIKND